MKKILSQFKEDIYVTWAPKVQKWILKCISYHVKNPSGICDL